MILRLRNGVLFLNTASTVGIKYITTRNADAGGAGHVGRAVVGVHATSTGGVRCIRVVTSASGSPGRIIRAGFAIKSVKTCVCTRAIRCIKIPN